MMSKLSIFETLSHYVEFLRSEDFVPTVSLNLKQSLNLGLGTFWV